MKNQRFRSRQRGLTLLGVLALGIVLAVAALVAFQVLPTLLEFQNIGKAVNKARDGSTPAEVRMLFDRAAQVDDIKSITSKDLEIKQENGATVVSFAYQREIHLAGPAYLTLKYTGRSK